jgi:hypothetical protein
MLSNYWLDGLGAVENGGPKAMFGLGSKEGSWRVGHQGRDGMYYEERHDGTWRRLELDGEMLVGRAHHVIYFGSRADWNSRPEWARARRDEIIKRIKSRFAIPDYEYQGEDILDEDDRVLLIAAAGGLSVDGCSWAGCKNRALKSKRLCVDHANRNAL